MANLLFVMFRLENSIFWVLNIWIAPPLLSFIKEFFTFISVPPDMKMHPDNLYVLSFWIQLIF